MTRRQLPEERPPLPDLENAIRGGTRAVVASQLLAQLISFAVLAALYRLIDPDQFGLLGMAIPLLLLSRIFATLGLNVATVQRRHLSDGQLSSLFWFSQIISLVVAAATATAGLFLAWLYETPVLRGLCAVLAGTLIIAALGAQHQALLERKLRMGRLAVARLAGQPRQVEAPRSPWHWRATVCGRWWHNSMSNTPCWVCSLGPWSLGGRSVRVEGNRLANCCVLAATTH